MPEYNYPALIQRVKAAIVDAICLFMLMIGFAAVFAAVGDVPDVVRIMAFVFVFGLYDPILTSRAGGTIGHFVIGIRVKRDRSRSENVSFLRAVLRFIVKVFLGWISLLTVPRSRDKRAIHDMAAGSVVLSTR